MSVWHYLDHAASTPARPEVIAALVPLLTEGYGNPSGAHALARAARAALDAARAELVAVVGGAPGDVVFTSGGTEADNLAVHGVLGTRGGVAVCSAIEHHAVLDPVRAAGGRVVPVDERGVIDLDALADALDSSVSLVSVMLVNNEVGTIQPLAEVAEVVRARAPGAVLHTDAAQALCWLDVRAHTEAADLVTIAAHKCGGPKGTGALLVRRGVVLEPMLRGGGQERDRRSGTQDVAGAVALAAAARASAADREALVARATIWRDGLVDTILAAIPGAVESAAVDGERSHLVAGIANLCLPAVDSEALLYLLEHDHRVLASAASSCASGAQEPSHVLAALGLDRSLAGGSLRLSMGWSTREADVAAATVGVLEAAPRLAAHARDGAPA
ncbi:MAG: aminotransferase class V-fold PLP-dependent enzyme [Acidimicrobiia bacterium]|nr:aminotransferase class V-fold PLP-dependent enzyme [Acidimicrobiia bacterium]